MNEKEYTISENMGFFINPFTPHEYYCIQEKWETHWVTFHGFAVPRLMEQVGLLESGIFFLQDAHLMEESFFQMLQAANVSGSFNGFQSSVYLYQFIIMCRNCISKTNKQKNLKLKQLEPLITYLEENYYRNPTLKDMADVLEITPHHLCRVFKEVFKIRPFVYLTKIKLQKAKELMTESENLTIKYIADKVGYNDISYFCSIFKEYEGITPTEFRSIHRQE
jgi:YesN/AraC family two-component response regulator